MSVDYSVLNAAGVVIRTGHCHADDLAHQAREGETVQEGLLPFSASTETHSWHYARKLAYPSLEAFADAFYWHQQGDDTKMNDWLAACAAVKSSIPKE
jgi:hypothetical protein